MRAHFALVLALVGGVAAGCVSPRTEILVWVSTDMPATGPASPNHLVITAWQSGQATRHATWTQGDAGPSLQAGRVVAVLYPGDNGSRSEVTVTVMPYHLGPGCAGGDGCPLYPSDSPGRAITDLVPGETLVIQIPLWSTCVNVTCLPDQSCYDGMCTDAHMRGTDFDGSLPGPLDGSHSTDAALDATTDIAPETMIDTGPCDAGLAFCGTTCVNLQNDLSNCGACGAACGSLYDTCSGGGCSCSTGTTCGMNCVDLNTDVRHCGSCGNNCQRLNTGDRCRGGNCCWSPC